MLTNTLVSHSLPSLRLTDTVHQALERMQEEQVGHLPVVDGESYVGLVAAEELMQASNEEQPLAELEGCLSPIAVKEESHFLNVLQAAAEHELSVIPVVNEGQQLTGTVTADALLRQCAEFLGLRQPGALIVLEMPANQYAFSEVSKLVETHNAQILQLNTAIHPGSGQLEVTLRLNKPEVSDIIATFQRYAYHVKYYFGEEHYTNELQSNYDHLMHYLKI
ncbi:MAG: hypothetical protein RJA57_335 [Bacteroidota bacterium]|jgi:CBS domain-containing protein